MFTFSYQNKINIFKKLTFDVAAEHKSRFRYLSQPPTRIWKKTNKKLIFTIIILVGKYLKLSFSKIDFVISFLSKNGTLPKKYDILYLRIKIEMFNLKIAEDFFFFPRIKRITFFSKGNVRKRKIQQEIRERAKTWKISDYRNEIFFGLSDVLGSFSLRL